MAHDLVAAGAEPAAEIPATPAAAMADDVEVIPVKGVRKMIAERMWASLQETAQLTLNATADARELAPVKKNWRSQLFLLVFLHGVLLVDFQNVELHPPILGPRSGIRERLPRGLLAVARDDQPLRIDPEIDKAFLHAFRTLLRKLL